MKRLIPAVLMAVLMMFIPEILVADDDYEQADFQNAIPGQATEGDYMHTSTEELPVSNQQNYNETDFQEEIGIDEDEMDGVQSYDYEVEYDYDEDE